MTKQRLGLGLAGAGGALSGEIADLEASVEALRRKDVSGRSLRVFPLDGTLPGSDGSQWTAQHSHLKNVETPLQAR